MATRGIWWALAGALALALALRLLYLGEIGGHPLFSALTGDPAVYHAYALDVLSGKLAPDHAFFHSSPLYPFFLALVSRLLGPGFSQVRAVQIAIGTASVALIFTLADLTVGRRPAIAASFLAALYTPFIFFEGELLEISIALACLEGMMILLLLARSSGRGLLAACAGVLLGLAALCKPNLLLLVPVGAGWLALGRVGTRGAGLAAAGRDAPGKAAERGFPARAPKERPTEARAVGRARRLAAAAIFAGATALVISPATIHNYTTSGDLIPVSSNGGINLYIGNRQDATGVFQVPPEMRFDLRIASKQAAERAIGRPLTAGEVSGFWARAARSHVLGSPGSWLRLMGRKLALFWNHYEIPNHYHFYYVAGFAPVLRNPAGSFAVVAPLGLVGLALALREKKRVALLIAFGATYMVSVVAFFITSRYRLPVVTVLLIGAGFALVRIWEDALRRRWRRLMAPLAAVAVMAGLVNLALIDFGFAQMHNTVGAILGSRGDTEGAAAHFVEALAENPADLSARYNLGVAELKLGRPLEAARHFRLAVEGHPRYFEAYMGLGKAYARAGRPEDATGALKRMLALTPPPPSHLAERARTLVDSLSALGPGQPEQGRGAAGPEGRRTDR